MLTSTRHRFDSLPALRAMNMLGGCLLVASITLAIGSAHGQVVGDEAEMDRLQVRAEDLIASGDPEGAATSMGRAALMAAQLAKRHREQAGEPVYRGAETLYRAQEHAYRALALYRRAGGQPPASTGVCHTLHSARTGVQQAVTALALDETARGRLSPTDTQRLSLLQAMADDWTTVIMSMASDFQCP